jgi:hypothetical protein
MSFLLLFAVLTLTDAAVTHFGVSRFGFAIESSPHFQYLSKRIGPIGFYVSPLFLIAMAAVVQRIVGDITVIGLCCVFAVILAWNLFVILSAELRLSRYPAPIEACLRDGNATFIRILGESRKKYLIECSSGDLKLIEKDRVSLN